jgi:hypothetical protein
VAALAAAVEAAPEGDPRGQWSSEARTSGTLAVEGAAVSAAAAVGEASEAASNPSFYCIVFLSNI